MPRACPHVPRPTANRNPRPSAAHSPVTFSIDGTNAKTARPVTLSFDLTRADGEKGDVTDFSAPAISIAGRSFPSHPSEEAGRAGERAKG